MSGQNSVKFAELHKNLAKLNLTTEELDLPVRVYNRLKRSGINNLQQLLAISYDELAGKGKRIDGICEFVKCKLEDLSGDIERGEMH